MVTEIESRALNRRVDHRETFNAFLVQGGVKLRLCRDMAAAERAMQSPKQADQYRAVAASRSSASAKARFSVVTFSSALSDTFGWAALFNSNAFALRFLAEAVADAPFCPARVFVFVAAESVRPLRLRPFAFDSPRLICRRPLDSLGRGLKSNTLHCAAHRLDTQKPFRRCPSRGYSKDRPTL